MKQALRKPGSPFVPLAMLLATAMWARADEPTTAPATPARKTIAVTLQEQQPGAKPSGRIGQRLQNAIVVQAKDAPDGKASATITLDVEMVKPGEYWLGIVCTPVEDELLKKHLGIEHGLVVKEIVKDSPAAQAGLEPQDILIQVGQEPLTDLKVLVETVEKTQENPLTLTLIRAGQRQTVDVTPVKRPASSITVMTAPDKETVDEWRLLQDSLHGHWMPQIIQEEGSGGDGTKMLFVMPGFVLPDQATDFPKNLEVTILKKGEAPAKITVKRDDEQWEVDSNSLDQLPDDIRPHVQRMLGGQLSVSVGGGTVNWSSAFPRPLVMPKVAPEILKKSFKVAPALRRELRSLTAKTPAEVREKIDAQLKEVQEQLDQARAGIPADTLDRIQQELKELRAQLEQLRSDRTEKAPQNADAPTAAEPKEAEADRQVEPETPEDGPGAT